MDTYIDTRFERLEKALTNLIDSVNKYHPSTIQAKELEAADQELTKGLEEIQTHQTNYLRLQQLRNSSAALDTQIKDTLSSLASTRTDITTTHTTTFPPGPSYPVAYDQLLNYARRISKTSMPPAGTIKPPSTTEPTSPAEAQTPAGVGASAAPTPSQPQSPAMLNGGGIDTPATQSQQAMTATQQSANTSLPEVVSQYLNPLSGQLFFPWPLEDKIRSGAMASNQILQEQGIDPKRYDPAEEEERKRKEEEERKEKEEEEKRQLEEKERRMREERERLRRQQEEWRKASATEASPDRGGPSRSNTGPAEKKQFQFASMDDLDDDDDDD